MTSLLAACASHRVTPAPAGDESAGDAIAGDAVAGRVDSFLTQLSAFGWSGSVSVERRGEVILRKGYGYADYPGRVRYHPETVFDIGSLAKTFTAVAILRLAQEGALSLNDPIDKFLSKVPDDKRGITLHHLLSHTAGIVGDQPAPEADTDDYDDVNKRVTVRQILEAPLDFQPGEDWSYSNSGYVLLAAVIENVTARPFRDYMRQHVFAPAGLRHTDFWGTQPVSDTLIARGHDALGNVLHNPARMSGTTWWDLGGGDIMSSLDDLRRWVHVLESDMLLNEPGRELLFTPQSKDIVPGVQYAYGWFVQKTPRGTTLRHHGGDYRGAGAELRWFSDDSVLVVTSTNVRDDLYPIRNIFDREAMSPLLFGNGGTGGTGHVPRLPVTRHDAAASQEEPAGAYRLPTGGLLRFQRIHGRLFVGAEGQDATDVLEPGPDSVKVARAWRSRMGAIALDGVLRGDLAALDTVTAGGSEPEFAEYMRESLLPLQRFKGAYQGVTALGTFASGYPAGNPPSREAALFRVTYARGDTTYVFRYRTPRNPRAPMGRVGFAEFTAFPLAAMRVIQPESAESWVGFDLVDRHEVRIRRMDNWATLRIASGGSTVTATRIATTTPR